MGYLGLSASAQSGLVLVPLQPGQLGSERTEQFQLSLARGALELKAGRERLRLLPIDLQGDSATQC